MSFQVCITPCLLDESLKRALDSTVWSLLAPRICSKKSGPDVSPETARTCAHRYPASKHTESVSQHPASHHVVAPWPSSIAHSVTVPSVIRAWPSSLCQSPGPPALVACCSGGINLYSIVACTASAADSILDCNLANATSRAKLFAGLHQSTAQELGDRIPQLACPPPRGLPRTTCWPRSQSQPWHTHQQRPLIRADLSLQPKQLRPQGAVRASVCSVLRTSLPLQTCASPKLTSTLPAPQNPSEQP